MTAGILIRSFGYFLTLGCYAVIFLLVLEWLVHNLPGAGLNPLRRALFHAAFPVLRSGDRYFPLALGNWSARGLLAAVVLWIVAKGLIPWVVWAGFALKG